MAVAAISPIAGFASVGGVTPLSGTASAGASAAAAPAGFDFGSALSKVQTQIDTADVKAQQLATGELTDVSDYTVAASKAQLGVQLTVALRNQMLSAYQEIMRMQV